MCQASNNTWQCFVHPITQIITHKRIFYEFDNAVNVAFENKSFVSEFRCCCCFFVFDFLNLFSLLDKNCLEKASISELKAYHHASEGSQKPKYKCPVHDFQTKEG